MNERDAISDAKKSLDIIDNNVYKKDNTFSVTRYNEHNEQCLIDTVYRTTNECSIEYMNSIIKKNDSVFSVASSGDQYLNSILYGASNVDLFDINVLTYYYTVLKITSVKVLSMEEFINFICNDGFMNKRIYDKVRLFLPNDVLKYFDYLYEFVEKSNIPNGINNLFYKVRDCELQSLCPYLTPTNFKLLKKSLYDRDYPKFILGDLVKLLPRLTGEYDVMLLSNIADYLDSFIDEEIAKKGFPHLKSDGRVQLNYMWGEERNCFAHDLVDFDKYNITFKSFDVVANNDKWKESILIMRK